MENQAKDSAAKLETGTIAAVALASKTPFMTVFKVTIGIGLARLVLFLVGASTFKKE